MASARRDAGGRESRADLHETSRIAGCDNLRRGFAQTIDLRLEDGAPLAWLGHSAGGAAGLCWLARVAAAAPIRGIVTLGTPGPRRLGPVRRTLAAATMAVSRVLGRFPARSLRFGNEDEAAEVIAEWMEWNVRGRWLGMDGFDYFAGLAALSTPYLGVAGGADWIFAPPKACRQVVERVGAARKMLAVAPGLSHRGLVVSDRARTACWPNVVAWLKETL